MSGENVPYHLRPNKFVERLLFIELLRHISYFKPLEEYSYISMGGKYLEDFKLIHEHLNLRELLSLEVDGTTFGRQQFNRPFSFINCIKKSTTEFLKTIDSFLAQQETNGIPQTIFWLDFANAKGRASQLRDFETAISKLISYDIVKITMNANIATVMQNSEDEDDSDESALQTAAIQKIQRILSEYCPARTIEKTELHDKGFAKILIEAIDRAGLKGLKNKRGNILHPLCAFRYHDGFHSMITYTVIILPKTELTRFESTTDLTNWNYYYPTTGKICDICIPDLSLKERMYINERLFVEPIEKMHKKMPFKLDASREISLAAIKSYIEHYRRYPNFARTIF